MAHQVQTENVLEHPQANLHQHEEHHVHGGPKIYAAVLATLLVLTVVTVAASRINFGSPMVNVVIAMLIASVKASLVALFFMHLRWDRPMNGIIFCTSLFFLGLFLIGCYSDTISRPPAEPTNLKPPAPTVAPGAASPSSGGHAIPGASPEGSHGGAAAGSNVKTPAPHK